MIETATAELKMLTDTLVAAVCAAGADADPAHTVTPTAAHTPTPAP